MLKSIVTKLWLAILALVLGILLVFSLFLSNRLETIYFSNQVRLMSENAQQWKEILTGEMPPDKIQREMVFWGRVSHYKIAVFDGQGIVRYSSDLDHLPIGKRGTWTHVKAGIEGREPYYTGYSPEFDMEMTATFLPFMSDDKAYLIMVHAATDDLMEMIKATRTIGVSVLLLFFILSGALVWYLSYHIARPIMAIREVTLEMAKGNFSARVNDDRKDELGDLARTINTLSSRLKTTLDYLSRANADLSDLLRKWKEFVADVSHELRTPLFLIQGYSEAVIDGIVKEEKTKNDYIEVINKESLRLQKLVNDLLAVESGLPLNKVDVNLYEFIKEMVFPFEIKAKDKNVKILLQNNLHELIINIDRDRFGEVIYNLIDNAIRYTDEGGEITIAGKKAGAYARITITDTGTGISQEHLPHLFDRFYRVDKARSRTQGGTGLGLAIAKDIVEKHGGEISVQSQLGEGTTFIINLPVK